MFAEFVQQQRMDRTSPRGKTSASYSLRLHERDVHRRAVPRAHRQLMLTQLKLGL
jgi:hypothetical protein